MTASFLWLRRKSADSARVWFSDGMAEWAPAWQVEELRPLFENQTADEDENDDDDPNTITPTKIVNTLLPVRPGKAAGNHYGGTAIGTFTVLEKQK